MNNMLTSSVDGRVVRYQVGLDAPLLHAVKDVQGLFTVRGSPAEHGHQPGVQEGVLCVKSVLLAAVLLHPFKGLKSLAALAPLVQI